MAVSPPSVIGKTIAKAATARAPATALAWAPAPAQCLLVNEYNLCALVQAAPTSRETLHGFGLSTSAPYSQRQLHSRTDRSGEFRNPIPASAPSPSVF